MKRVGRGRRSDRYSLKPQFHTTNVWNLRKLPVPSLALHLSGFSLFSFFFSSSLSSHLVSFLPVWPLQVLCYLRANTGIHEPCTSTALWKRKPLCRSSWKAPSIVLCVPRWDEGSSWEKSGFCNQSHMLGKTASCRTRKIFVVNTSAWLSSGMPVCHRCFADWTPVQL